MTESKKKKIVFLATIFFRVPIFLCFGFLLVGESAGALFDYGLLPGELADANTAVNIWNVYGLLFFSLFVVALILYYARSVNNDFNFKHPSLKRIGIFLYFFGSSIWFLIALPRMSFKDVSLILVIVQPSGYYICIISLIASLLFIIKPAPGNIFLKYFYFDLEPMELNVTENSNDENPLLTVKRGTILFVDTNSREKKQYLLNFKRDNNSNKLRILCPRSDFLDLLGIYLTIDVLSWVKNHIDTREVKSTNDGIEHKRSIPSSELGLLVPTLGLIFSLLLLVLNIQMKIDVYLITGLFYFFFVIVSLFIFIECFEALRVGLKRGYSLERKEVD